MNLGKHLFHIERIIKVALIGNCKMYIYDVHI